MNDLLDRLINRAWETASLVRPLLAPRFTQGPPLAASGYPSSLEEISDWAEAPGAERDSHIIEVVSTSAERVPRRRAKPFEPDDPQPAAIPPEQPGTAALHAYSIAMQVGFADDAAEPGKAPPGISLAKSAQPRPSQADILPAGEKVGESLPSQELTVRHVGPSRHEPDEVDEVISPSLTHQIARGSAGEMLSAPEILKLETTERKALLVPQAKASVPRPLRLAPNRPANTLASLPPPETTTLPDPSDISLESAPQPQQVVRVTIGRIDVRAVMPSPPPQYPAHPPSLPALSLDDYLKQRSGGSR